MVSACFESDDLATSQTGLGSHQRKSRTLLRRLSRCRDEPLVLVEVVEPAEPFGIGRKRIVHRSFSDVPLEKKTVLSSLKARRMSRNVARLVFAKSIWRRRMRPLGAQPTYRFRTA